MNKVWEWRVSAFVTGFVVALLFLLLSSCAPSPKNFAQGYAIESEADIAAENAEQTREIAREEQDWENAKRTEKAEYWASIEKVAQVAGQVLTVFVYIFLIAFLAVLAYFLTEVLLATASAYKVFLMIRSRMVHVDPKTGMRPMVFWPAERTLPENSSHDEMNFWNIFKKRHVEPTRWMLVDGATEEHSYLDAEQPASAAKNETARQAVLNYQILMHQAKSAKHSPEGEVAEAMGHSGISLPDAGQVLLEAAAANLSDLKENVEV